MCLGAESLYHMTSFTSGVSIDDHNAMTDYDKAVFLGKESTGTVGRLKFECEMSVEGCATCRRRVRKSSQDLYTWMEGGT
eukprot:768273-Hanusia_phi.AAC.7